MSEFVRACLVFVALAPTACGAGTFVVTSSADSVTAAGMTLRNAIGAAHASPGPHTITFSPALAGQTIAVSSQFVIDQRGISILGLADSNGRPAITLDATAATPILFAVHASDFSLKRLRVVHVRAFGLWVYAGADANTPPDVSNLSIEGNEFSGDGLEATSAIPVTIGTANSYNGAKVVNVDISGNSFAHFRTTPGESGGDAVHIHVGGTGSVIQNMVIRDNTFSDTTFPVEIVADSGSNNRIVGTQIYGNTFEDCNQAVNINNIGTVGREALRGNSIEGTLVARNVFRGNAKHILIYGGVSNATGNSILNTEIIDNQITDSRGEGGFGLLVVGGTDGATQNRIDGIRIANNTIRNNTNIGVWLLGGIFGSHGNSIRNASVVNNLVVGNSSGIVLTGGREGSSGNDVAGVGITNNTIANNRPVGIDATPDILNSSGNSISDVTVTNSILWGHDRDFSGVGADRVFSSLTMSPQFAGANGNIASDPMFVDAATGDFHLRGGSQAIKAGRTTGAPFDDIECRNRAAPPDIGALESGAPSTCVGPGINFTALWWNPSESGWGINVNHQGTILFATLFDYASDGRNMWLVASELSRQLDGSYSGPLYRTTGPAFDRTPWTSIGLSQVGTMTLRFPTAGTGSLSYSVDGIPVTKIIQKQFFAFPMPKCVAVTTSREQSANYQDLWWNSRESGWGINLTHQGNVIFATLFTYDTTGRDLWLVASSLGAQPDGSFSGSLYSTGGPAFNSPSWSSITASQVGTMTLRFTSGTTGTLAYVYNGVPVSKSIERQVFSAGVPECR
ncbi:MAG: hypothetical protein IPP91_15135 [Betaproteobacteria bacterium]|nr:hypothetical protein [Betaproteobacteria bacterium]